MTKRIDEQEAERHRAKMAKRKAVQDEEVAGKKLEKGLLIVHTGTGKGKSTAAFGLALRMLGRGRRIGVVQFIKGGWHSAERDAFEKFGDQVAWHSMGEGFTWETQDLARDIEAAERAWAKAQELMADPSFALVILDELNIALRYDYLPLDKVVAALKARQPELHVVVTGRNAKPALIEAADLVSVMSQSPTLSDALLRFAHFFSVQSGYTALANAHGKVEERLARWLLMAQDRIASKELILTHEFLALMLGVRRAGVTVALQHFEVKGLITAARGSMR